MRIAPQWANRRRLAEHRARDDLRRLNTSFRASDVDGLVSHLVADDLSDDLSDTDFVEEWPSRDGGTGYGTFEISGVTFQTNELNGLPVVRFGGSSSMAHNQRDFASDALPTVIMVVKPSAVTNSDMMFSVGNDFVDGGVFSVTGEVALRVRGGNTVFDAACSTSAFQILTVGMSSQNGNTGEAWIDGSALGVSSSSSQATSWESRSCLAGQFDSAGGASYDSQVAMDLAEIVVYDRRLSTPERELVEGYLNDKYAIF